MVICRACRVILTAIAVPLIFAVPVRSDDWSNLRLVRDNREDRQPRIEAGKSRLDLSDSTNELETAGLVLLRLYQLVLSSQDGPRCMFYPSCSEYAKQALVEHGAVTGSLMAIDRYLRCNGVDRDLYPYDPNIRKLLDPVPQRKSGSSSR